MNKKISIQDIHRKRRIEDFLGRGSEVARFRNNLLLPFQDRKFIWNIFGQGGVGKSTLLKRYQSIAKEHNALTALVDESRLTILESMNAIVIQLQRQGAEFEKFTSQYRLYLQLNEQIATDPDMPDGMSAMLGRVVGRIGIAMVRQVPVAGLIVDFAGEDQVVEKTSEYASFLARKLGNKDKVKLILEPVEVLTPLFLEGLLATAEHNIILIGLDTYERTGDFLDRWLYSILDGKYGDVDPDIIIIIAGRHRLGIDWSDYNDLVQYVPLETFNNEEAREFLLARGINDEAAIKTISKLSRNLPLWLATLASQFPTDASNVDDPTSDAVDRFLKWIDDKNLRRAAILCAIPENINRDIISILFNEDESYEIFDWLKGQPFIQQNTRNGWVYHEVVRSMILRHLRYASYGDWINTNNKLADRFSKLRDQLEVESHMQVINERWLDYDLSWLYHKLCASGDTVINNIANEFLIAFDRRSEYGMRWGVTIRAAGESLQSQSLIQLGDLIIGGVAEYIKVNPELELDFFNNIYKNYTIHDNAMHILLSRRGYTLGELERYEEALNDLNRAIELDPKYAWSFASRGAIHRLQENFQEALDDFSFSLNLDPDDAWILASRGEVLIFLERYDEAIVDFNKAIELDSEYEWALANRGILFGLLGEYEKGISDFTSAIKLDSLDAWNFASRGELYKNTKYYNEALRDFDRAIELDSKYIWALSMRAETYEELEDYEKALTDYTHAIELDSSSSYLYVQRGYIYYKQGMLELALNDFVRSCALDPDDPVPQNNRAFILRRLGKLIEARDAWHVATNLQDSPDYAFAGYAIVMEELEQHSDAIIQYKKAVEMDPRWVSNLEEIAEEYIWTTEMIDIASKITSKLI